MAQEVQSGKGVLFGIPNDGSPITIEGVATFTLETAKLSRKFKLAEVEDENGFDCALIATNAMDELDVTWTPTAQTRAAAAGTAVMLNPLARMTLSHFKVAAFNGVFIVMGDQGIDLSRGVGKMQLKLRRYVDPDQNTSLSTTVSG